MSDWDDHEAHNFAMAMEAEEAEHENREREATIDAHFRDREADTWEQDRPWWVTG